MRIGEGPQLKILQPLRVGVLTPSHLSTPPNTSSHYSPSPTPIPPSPATPAPASPAIPPSPKLRRARSHKNPANPQTIPLSISAHSLHPPGSLPQNSPASPASTIPPAPASSSAARSPAGQTPSSNKCHSFPSPQIEAAAPCSASTRPAPPSRSPDNAARYQTHRP